MTKLYQITLPVRDNAGRSFELQHKQFAAFVLDRIGGFTEMPLVHGAWIDNSVTYRDASIPYQIACNAGEFAKVQAKAFELFADQLAIMTAEIGTANIVMREAETKAA